MANYKKMYAILCGAIDDTTDSLEQIPQAHYEVEKLKAVLLETEEMFINSADKEDLAP